VEPVSGAGAKLLQAWKQYQGRVYDPQLLTTFISENSAYLAPHATKCQLVPVYQDT